MDEDSCLKLLVVDHLGLHTPEHALVLAGGRAAFCLQGRGDSTVWKMV